MTAHESAPSVSVSGLSAEYRTRLGVTRALDDVSLDIAPGELVAVVGESGSGKTTISQAIGRMLPRSCRITAGEVRVLGRDLASLAPDEVRRVRRESLGFIPQDPIASLNPTMRIRRQLELALAPLGRPTDAGSLVELLRSVRILEPERVLRLFPHEVSGGMAQRIAIALTIAREPSILIADEPTASLDAQVRDEILELIVAFVRRSGASLIWISHDLGAVRRWCDRVVVMHRGAIVESGPTARVLDAPEAEYTRTLVAAIPARSRASREGEERA
ncbi:ABC transporter ATP-binding protein [Leucobacter chromiiresistens]|uniref:ABC-type dipeptide/oligopeptide/nickel transport system, ATPase component n=1 Tax=Leucobacter chromiiresistens TaxID=1079994 RepID=A0A1H0YU28_9MICO|nr:ABC transporter ATP-binding protein [Leucobacter chromiiresistens]SDQ18376.1 ABC-type dipeptide/oligopeptide/nickel transport system, ATPase component [Leucobacter chromiiresistens]